MSLPVLDDFTLLEESVDTPPVCESQHCEEVLGKPAHEAHFIGSFPDCGWTYLLCRHRVEMFAHQNLIECNCGGNVPANLIRLTEL